MAKGLRNGRLIGVAGVTAFIAGCWVGMDSESAGDAYCVVTAASAGARPGHAAGQLVERSAPGCEPGEPVVCGRFEPEIGEDRRFESARCAG
jgi:hypothetical protein